MFSEEFNEKVKLFVDAANFEHTKTVPNLSNDYTWKIYDAGVTYSEAYHNNKKMEKIVCENHERYDFDAYLDLGTRNHFPQMEALGGGAYQLNEETGGINVVDEPCMEPEDYAEFTKDPMAFFNVLFQRKFPDITTDDFVKATMSFLQSSGFSKDITEKFVTKYNRPTMVSTSASVIPAFDAFHNSFRGIKGVSMDLRRHKEELKDACDAYWEAMVKPGLQRALAVEEKNYICDVYTALISHNVLNQAQFEEFFWPQLKYIIDETAKQNKIVYLYVEGTFERFADYLKDVPKGSVIMHLENDDIFKMRELLPNICLAGGMTTDMLGGGTPEQCVDYAKKLVDELGDGYIMSQTKMLSFKNDCKRENLLAINDFIHTYTR